MKFICSLLLAALLSGCATFSEEPQSATPASTPGKLSDGVHWYRDSAEQIAVYRQTYRAATAAAEKLSAGKAKLTWAVILDVDETVLDNSDFQKRLSLSGQPYRPEAWDAWVGERNATALPGAREFMDAVRGMGGRVVLVTNRAQSLCAATEDNLRAQRVAYDRILCDRAGDEDKNGRFAAVRQGGDGNSPLEVLIWVGDNIKDFPSLNQQSTDGFTEFGSRYFALPNPMYGSWQGVPPR